jgi:hypothetical protein
MTVPSDEALDKGFWLASPQVLHLLLLFRWASWALLNPLHVVNQGFRSVLHFSFLQDWAFWWQVFSGWKLIILTTQIAKEPENAGKLIVVLLPSSAVWYLITPLFTDIKEECKN